MASECLHTHLKEKLNSISHMLILDQEEFAKQHLKHGLILNINSEKLIIGALQETFVEFVSNAYYSYCDFSYAPSMTFSMCLTYTAKN